MYVLKAGIKQNQVRRWHLPDRIFFGHGACHILAGVFLQRYPEWHFEAQWLKPKGNQPGNHVFVTDGRIAFDYHGYSLMARLLNHHNKVWQHQYDGWSAETTPVDFSLLDTAELNARGMRGPDQYHGDVIIRAHRYLDRIDHNRHRSKVEALLADT